MKAILTIITFIGAIILIALITMAWNPVILITVLLLAFVIVAIFKAFKDKC